MTRKAEMEAFLGVIPGPIYAKTRHYNMDNFVASFSDEDLQRRQYDLHVVNHEGGQHIGIRFGDDDMLTYTFPDYDTLVGVASRSIRKADVYNIALAILREKGRATWQPRETPLTF